MEGTRFALTPGHVASVTHRLGKKDDKDKGFDYTVTDAVTGKVTATYTVQRRFLSDDAYGNQPFHYDEEAIADFEGNFYPVTVLRSRSLLQSFRSEHFDRAEI